MRIIILAIALVSVTACSRIRYIPLAGADLAPLPPDAVVDVVITEPPHCPYREVGVMTARARSFQKALPRLRERARLVGANMLWVRSGDSRKVEALALRVRCRA